MARPELNKPPRDLPGYTTAEEAASGLEELALHIRTAAAVRPLVKWRLSLDFWNPAWVDSFRPGFTFVGVTYDNAPGPAALVSSAKVLPEIEPLTKPRKKKKKGAP